MCPEIPKVEFALSGSDACQDFLFDVLFVELTGSFSDVVWSPPPRVLLLGHFGRDSGAGQCLMLLWLALGYLFGAAKQSTVCVCLCWSWCVWEWPSCAPRLISTSTKPGVCQQKAQGTPSTALPTSSCQLPVRLAHWKRLCWYVSCMR